ncbi:MAG: TrmH family RNA methyltransferase [Candidatus Paceibacterota bacterium]
MPKPKSQSYTFEPREQGTLPYNINAKRNVADQLAWAKREDILKTINENKIPISLLLVNIDRDNNIGNIIRSANTFGVQEVLIYGRKKFDRRTSVGAEFFMQFRHIKFIEDLSKLKQEFDLIIGLEQTKNSVELNSYNWPKDKNILVAVGNESGGLPQEVLDICDTTLEIEQYGTTRSLNVSVATGIILYDYRMKNNCKL